VATDTLLKLAAVTFIPVSNTFMKFTRYESYQGAKRMEAELHASFA
jgi:hypothetical protein